MAGVIVPTPPRAAVLSLINSAPVADAPTNDPRWELGYRFQPEACGGAFIEDPCERVPRVVPDRPARVEIEPFNVVAGDHCSAMGFLAQDYEARALRLLQRCTSHQVASELWTGTLAAASNWPNPYLTDPTSDTLTNGPAGAIAALACLEQALAQSGCGDRGMIHATPQLVTHWAALGNSVLRREGGLLLTIHDTIIVSDGGYDGSGPGGVPAGDSQWAYATGMVTVRLGRIFITPGPDDIVEAMDRAVNDVEFFAERPAAYDWDQCAHFAAEIDLGICLFGGAS